MEDLSRRIRILLDGKGAENSITELRKHVRQWTRDLEKAEAGSDKYNAALKKIQEAKPILEDHKKQLRGIADANDQIQAKGSKMVNFAASIFTVSAVAEFGAAVFRAGKELGQIAIAQEALAKKASTVLGPSLDSVTASAERHAAAMGLTTSQYVNAATSAADLLIPMGFQRDAAAQISTEMVNLSGALSEWTGGQRSSTEVSDILTKSLLGEREELKGLGISISEADVQQRLAANGMKNATGQALEQAKAMATLQLITEKSADAQTAYANGADSNARKVAQLTARFDDMKERLANFLLPVFDTILNVLDEAGHGFQIFVDNVSEFFGGKNEIAVDVVQKSSPEEEARLAAEKAKVAEQLKEQARRAEQQKIAEENAKKRSEERKRELIQAEKDLRALNKDLSAVKQKILEENEPDERARVLAAVDREYAARLEKAIELEKKGVRGAADARKAVEDLIRQERDAAEQEYLLKKLEEQSAYEQKIIEAEQARIDAENSALLNDLEGQNERDAQEAERRRLLQDTIRTELLTEQDAELETLNAHYTSLLELAEIYGLDTTALRAKQAKEVADIEKKYAEETTAKHQAENTKRLQAQQALFQGLGELATAAGELFSGEAGKNNKVAKIATLAQIALDTASAISSLVKGSEAAGAASGPLAPIVSAAAFASGLARILINIKKAKELLASAPELPQRATGGWTDVTGADDGQLYHARYIGQVGTGLLDYAHPVVLANEGGKREYFVDHETLRNPVALNHVRAIENIKSGGRPSPVPQMAEGGFTQTGGGSATQPPDFGPILAQLGMLLARLSGILDNGVVAVIEDRTVVDLMKRQGKLLGAANGTLQQ